MLPHPTFPVTAKTRQLLRWAWYAAIVVVIVTSVLPSDSRPTRALDALSISDKFEHLAAYAVASRPAEIRTVTSDFLINRPSFKITSALWLPK